jgi:hypothetical protein
MIHFNKSCFFLLPALILLAQVTASRAEVSVSVSINTAPPALPVYEQPACPDAGYIWVPGYWAYGDDGYYWVPGVWVLAPRQGYLWTPGYWGWSDGFYVWHEGYWGRHVGFYGGVCYGFGYTGVGFYGGYWRSGVYCYNRSVTNVNVTVVHNTYNKTVVNNTSVSRVSFNGGTGGIVARPTATELVAARETHIAPVAVQTQHQQSASTNRELLASANHGQPSRTVLAKAVAASPAAKVNNVKPPRPQNKMSRPKQPQRPKERREP